MINNDDNNKEGARGAAAYVRPDSNAICDSLVSKLTDKSDEEDKPKSKGKERVRPGKDRPDAMSVSEDSDDESDWSAAASPSPLKKPRAFEKSDHLYEKQLEKEWAQESEDWTWEAEEFLLDDCENGKDIDNSYKP